VSGVVRPELNNLISIVR